MSERAETVHIVMRQPLAGVAGKSNMAKPVKSADDRSDARKYAKRMNERSKKFYYYVEPCKKL